MIGFGAAAFFCAAAGSSPRPHGPTWKVVLRVESQGEYRSESTPSRTDGSFTLAIAWTGTIEKDGPDFLLVHTGCVLEDWRIEERDSDEDTIRLITEKDAPDKPELRMNYVLNEAGRIRFDFAVVGFDVPLGGGAETFPLVLPVSAESGSKVGAIAYNAAVRSGSNDVAVDEAKILAGPVEETFGWTWRRQAWVQSSDRLVFQSNGHKVKVTLTITPEDGTCRKPSASVRG